MVPSPKKAYGDEQEFLYFPCISQQMSHGVHHKAFWFRGEFISDGIYFNKMEQSALLLHRNVSYSFKGKQKNINFNCHGHISNYGIKLRALTIKPQTVP